jgi:hypothetical protein
VLRSGQFRGQKGLGPLEKSLELSHYEFCPPKKNNLPHFPNQRYINSYIEIPILVYALTAANKPSHNFNPNSINRFKQSLFNVLWNDVYKRNYVNESFNRLWTTLSGLLFTISINNVSRLLLGVGGGESVLDEE